MMVKRQKCSIGVLFHIDTQPNNSQFTGENKLSILQNPDVKTVGENKPSLVNETVFKFSWASSSLSVRYFNYTDGHAERKCCGPLLVLVLNLGLEELGMGSE